MHYLKRFLLVGWLLFCAGNAFAFPQLDFTNPAVIYQSDFSKPKSGEAADLDGDGDNDIIAISSEDDRIVWFENLGNDAFGEMKVLCDDIKMSGMMAVAPLFSNGHMDIVVISDRDIVWVLKNTGNADFTPIKLSDAFYAAQIASLILVDFNGDGLVDINVLRRRSIGNYDLTWYENRGDGTFRDESTLLTGLPSEYKFQLTDVDGDGQLDVLYKQWTSLYCRHNMGQNTFGSRTWVFEVGDISLAPMIDFDQDGDGDIVYWDGGNAICWAENQGANGFVPDTLFHFTDSDWHGVEMLPLCDFNGDGSLDILYSYYNVIGKRVGVLFNQESDGFRLASSIGLDEVISDRLAFKELNGDDYLDILDIRYWGNSLCWYASDEDGRYSNAIELTESLATIRQIELKDMNGDALPDVIALSALDNKISWYANLGNGTWGGQKLLCRLPETSDWMLVHDFDSDGDNDVLSQLGLHLNNGSGIFAKAVPLAHDPYGNYLWKPQLADMNRDGIDDLIWTGYQSLVWRLNDGTGQFAVSQGLSLSNSGIKAFKLADMDDDGDLDLFAIQHYEDQLFCFENIDGAFRSVRVISYPTLHHVLQFEMADMDGDGDKDVLAVTYMDDNFQFVENIGNGVFAPHVNLRDFSNGPGSFAVMDADADGDWDLAVLDDSGSVGWLLNDGTARFENAEMQIRMNHESASHHQPDLLTLLKPGDLDGDGDVDLIFAGDRTLYVSENNHNDELMPDLPDKFVLHPNFPNPFNPYTRLVFDLEEGCRVKAEVFNSLGQRVTTLADEWMESGTHKLTWISEGLPSGVYLCRLKAGDKVFTRKLVKVE